MEEEFKDRFEVIYELYGIDGFMPDKEKWVNAHVNQFLDLFTEAVAKAANKAREAYDVDQTKGINYMEYLLTQEEKKT